MNIEKQGFSINDLVNLINETEVNPFFTNIEEEEKDKLRLLDNKIRNYFKQKKKTTTKEQGDLLENYVKNLLKCNKHFFSFEKNVTTSDNEIDFLVILNTTGKYWRSKEVIPSFIPDTFLIECKNYAEKVNITMVNKFQSLLLNKNNCKLGLFFAFNGITGDHLKKTWGNAYGLIKKINLLNNYNVLNFSYLLPITKNDFNIFEENNYNMVESIEQIKRNLDFDINNSFK